MQLLSVLGFHSPIPLVANLAEPFSVSGLVLFYFLFPVYTFLFSVSGLYFFIIIGIQIPTMSDHPPLLDTDDGRRESDGSRSSR